MISISFSSMTRLILIAIAAAAAPSRATEKPVPPTPDAMHKKLVQISKNPEKLAAALQNGKKASSVCMHCHGAGGNSTQAEVPNLASQNADYLLEQMNKFVLGQRRSSAFMEGMIKAMTPDERIDISLFLAQQPVTRKPAGISTQSIAGKKIYDKLCITCHGADGAGSHKIPRLAGQQVKYVEGSLKRYRNGNGERIDPRMAAYTRNLKDADIENLAAYLFTLQP
ncbi:MAG: cytochrome C [Hydrogenophilales bacterium 17-61-9]|nr:MAG: cytochrome C [Hydrogenophilales bacterium 17-61-9]